MGLVHIGDRSLDDLLATEWLAVNHVGGYASSTLPGLNTRKYHGLLVAAMTPPVRRMVLLSRVEETVHAPGRAPAPLACNEYPGVIHPHGHRLLRAFAHEPTPTWTYQGDGWRLERQLRLLHGENTVLLTYTLLDADAPVELELRPLFALRAIHELMYQWNGGLAASSRHPHHHRIPPTARTPEVFFAHDGDYDPQGCWYFNTIYRREPERGYAGLEDLWMPGTVRAPLAPGGVMHFACSTEPLDLKRTVAHAHRQANEPPAHARSAAMAMAAFRRPQPDATIDALARAAAQFVVEPPATRVPAVISAYPWRTMNVRDALIALPGLFLVPGRLTEARRLLESMAPLVRDGLLPSFLGEDGNGWTYTAADTALWYAAATHEYLRYAPGDDRFAGHATGVLNDIVAHYLHGTRLGIAADSDLIATHAPGIPTTWMDAWADTTVFTQRHGCPVELNALWYNALRVTAQLAFRAGNQVRGHELDGRAQRVRTAFNARFWNPAVRCCFDVVRPDAADDASIRPNQLFALSLPYPVLDLTRHADVLEVVRATLLTPVGLRTLAPGDPHYRGRHRGDAAARDAACHQGTVFPWLLGPYVRAHLRVHGRGAQARAEARRLIEHPLRHLLAHGAGHLPELYDGDAPHAPGGAPASALAAAEMLRCYVEDILDQAPPAAPVADTPAETPLAAPGTIPHPT